MKKALIIPVLILMMYGFTDSKHVGNVVAENEKIRLEIDSLKNIIKNNSKSDMKAQITTFLTFQENNAEEAMNFYIDIFDNSEIIEIQRHGKDGPAKEGSVFKAVFSLNGKEFICTDSYIKHEWDFSPAVSMFVECKSNDEQDKLFGELSEGGKVFMGLNNYGFSQRFGWVEDKFGISWQLNLQ